MGSLFLTVEVTGVTQDTHCSEDGGRPPGDVM